MATNNSSPYKGGLNMNILDTLGLVPSSFGVWKERLKENPVGLMDASIGVTQEATGSG